MVVTVSDPWDEVHSLASHLDDMGSVMGDTCMRLPNVFNNARAFVSLDHVTFIYLKYLFFSEDLTCVVGYTSNALVKFFSREEYSDLFYSKLHSSMKICMTSHKMKNLLERPDNSLALKKNFVIF